MSGFFLALVLQCGGVPRGLAHLFLRRGPEAMSSTGGSLSPCTDASLGGFSAKRGWCASEEHTRSFDTLVPLGMIHVSFLLCLAPVNGCLLTFRLNSASIASAQRNCGDAHNRLYRRHPKV